MSSSSSATPVKFFTEEGKEITHPERKIPTKEELGVGSEEYKSQFATFVEKLSHLEFFSPDLLAVGESVFQKKWIRDRKVEAMRRESALEPSSHFIGRSHEFVKRTLMIGQAYEAMMQAKIMLMSTSRPEEEEIGRELFPDLEPLLNTATDGLQNILDHLFEQGIRITTESNGTRVLHCFPRESK